MRISRRKRKTAAALAKQLDEARREKREVAREGASAKPLLGRLQRHLEENHFAERLVAQIDASRRRPTSG